MKKFLLFFFILFVSCDKTGPTEYGFLLSDVRFAAGTRYTYGWSVETRDSIGNLMYADQDTIVVVIEATDDQIGTLQGLIRVRAYSLVDSIGSTRVWYQNSDSSCAEMAYENAGYTPVVLPKKGTARQETTTGPRANPFFIPLAIQNLALSTFSMQTDSMIMRDDPRIVFKYPLKSGGSWVSFTSPWLQTRQVIASEFVQVPAGTYYCMKIKTDSPIFGGSLEWFDYVSEEGLMLRTLDVTVMLSDAESPEGTGTATIVERTELLRKD